MDQMRNKMWKGLQKTGGYWGIFVTCYNLMFQLFTIFTKPRNDTYLRINIAYTVISVITLCLFTIAYCGKNKTRLILLAYVLAALRTGIRLFDIEESRYWMSRTEWYLLQTTTIFFITFYIMVFILYFSEIKG